MKVIDLRSDTVTQPTRDMRIAMSRAEVGDDGWGDDPTVNKLERMGAELMGKESAVFNPSGTMSNLISILTHCKRGEEIIIGDESHIFHYEVGGSAALAGVHVRTVPNDAGGRLHPAEVEAAVRPDDLHFPKTVLICLENTHNRCGGRVLTVQDTRKVGRIAQRHGIPFYLDGARIFNAAVYLGMPARDLAQDATTVSFSLSKGLSAPAGSLLCGSAEFIARARKYRQMLGGTMRQTGILAAAGIVALEKMVDRLQEDHDNARFLAEGLEGMNGIAVDAASVQTNMVVIETKAQPALKALERLEKQGVKAAYLGEKRLRMVTHYGIDRRDVERTIAVCRKVFA